MHNFAIFAESLFYHEESSNSHIAIINYVYRLQERKL